MVPDQPRYKGFEIPFQHKKARYSGDARKHKIGWSLSSMTWAKSKTVSPK
jgi:hypothetical protein